MLHPKSVLSGQSMARWLTLAGCALLLPASIGQADEPGAVHQVPDKPTLAAEIAQALEPIRVKHKLPALAGAIVNSRGMLAGAAVGKRRRDGNVASTVDDLWHMGSCTKALTASMIASLVEEGKMRWETTVEESFPDAASRWPADFRPVTVLHLLSHRSGLPANLAWGNVPRDLSWEAQRDVVLRCLESVQLESKPGTKFSYSNTGYVVAGMMAEAAAKSRWDELMRQRVFQPLDMQQARLQGLGDHDNGEQPWPHEMDGRPLGEPAPASSAAAGNPVRGLLDSFSSQMQGLVLELLLGEDGEAPVAGAAGATLRLSLSDWGKFVADHLRGDRGEPALLKPATYQVLHKPPFRGNYALGWGIEQRPWAGGRTLTHSGSNAKNFSTVWIAPNRNFAVLVCTNQANPAAADAAATQLILLHEKHFPPGKPEQNGKAAQHDAKAPEKNEKPADK